MTNDPTSKLSPHAVAGVPVSTSFVPADLDASRWENLEPLYANLLARAVTTPEELERWLLDRSELDAAASESRANLYIRMTCHTDDAEATRAWTAYLDDVPPKRKPVVFRLDQRQMELFEAIPLDAERYGLLGKRTRREIELFDERNVPLETEVEKLEQEYDEVCGAMSVEFDGEERTIPQMERYLQVTDRDVRERAWHATAERRLADRERIESIFDAMVDLRQRLARNAGFENFRDFQHERYLRFDYTPADCERFHAGVEEHVVPFLRRLDERRRRALGVDVLRPWDLKVDEHGRPPLAPFANGQELVEKSRAVFDALDPDLGKLYATLGDDVTVDGGGFCFDLDSRKGKTFGGYQYMRDRIRVPFIFMNAAGLHRDVETMVHEAGHAFHSFLCAHEPLLAYRDYQTEIAEVASMAMELLSMPYWDRYYPDASDLHRARKAQLEGAVTMLAWIATIDAFQHWLYTHVGHSRDERRAAWLDISRRFGHHVSWAGLEEAEAYAWQRQGHLFGNPFYYIEYGIAQLGALGIWLHARERGEAEALRLYKQALVLGGSKSLPELFGAADLAFDFGPEHIGRLVGAVEKELAETAS